MVPGGKVVVYTGMLKILQNEAQLATILAHEVAHVLARHVVRVAAQVACQASLVAEDYHTEWQLHIHHARHLPQPLS